MISAHQRLALSAAFDAHDWRDVPVDRSGRPRLRLGFRRDGVEAMLDLVEDAAGLDVRVHVLDPELGDPDPVFALERTLEAKAEAALGRG